ncbi:DUF2589 domain-containing protein [Veronia nyctiphanis]|uniref:DUF2589 domain-containing protein n=1 Tax=Veronia nyctiphanis TaxID=1278244 RepID=UPI0013760F06|nr:DUF2589 domain-containing protein [Veronia nyctiphanis]
MQLSSCGKNNANVSKQYLDAIVRGLSYVANCASELNLNHYQNIIDQYFYQHEDDDEGVLSPRTIQLKLDDNHIIEMPLISVVDAKGLYLDELDVDFSVKMTGIEESELHESMVDDINHPPKFIVDIAPGTRDETDTAKISSALKPNLNQMNRPSR